MTLKTFRNGVNLEEMEVRFVEKRMEYLQQLNKNELMELVALYEVYLLDFNDRLLSDNPFPLNCDTALSFLDHLEEGALQTFLSVDTEQEYDGLHQYANGEA